MSVSRSRDARRGPLWGAVAASVTPLSVTGDDIDPTRIDALVDLYCEAGLRGAMLGGTTGEGVLLTVDERCRLTDAFLAAAAGRLDIVVHAGAVTTADALAVARHAAAAGAAAVSVIAPPYFRLDDAAVLEYLVAAARACAPTPFYVYEFADRSGYPVTIEVLHRLAELCPTFVGLKVSDAPFDRFEPYLLPWLDVLVGPESLIAAALARGAVGAVSALAAAFPELVAEAVSRPGDESSAQLSDLRRAIERRPLHAALKAVLRARGVPINETVRAPLRPMTDAERTSLQADIDSVIAQPHADRR